MATWSEDLISLEEAGTLDGLFLTRVHRTPDSEAYRTYQRFSKEWISYSWQEMSNEVSRWRSAILNENLAKGDRIAVLLRNCAQWVMYDQAALSLGLVLVPLYTDDNPENICYILNDANIKLLLIQDAGRWKRLAPVIPDEGDLNRVIILEPSDEANKFKQNDDRIILADDWLPEQGSPLKKRDKADGNALASIVYTSGTTGKPKGVMLSHLNMMSVAHAGVAMIDIYKQDVFLSFLPLSHTLERTAGYYLPMMTGASVVYSRSVAMLATDLQNIKPTALVSVPRIFEKIYAKISDQLAKGSVVKRWMFNTAVKIGWAKFEYTQGRGSWKFNLLFAPLFEKLVASKIQQKLGGSMRVIVSGGAPLSPDIARIFIGLGMPILQGYGLTETSPVISVNTLTKNDPSSVGMPLAPITTKIGENNELLVKSPGVMLGYWNNHAATAKIIDADGWLHTGDQVKIENNFIYITGRIKDILVLSNGEKVPPADMEMSMTLDAWFEQVMVIGEGKPYMVALAVLSEEELPDIAKEYGIEIENEGVIDNKKLNSAILKRFRTQLSAFPGYAKIRKVAVMSTPWSVDNGLMTPTMKVKRPQVMKKYATEIEKMYQ